MKFVRFTTSRQFIPRDNIFPVGTRRTCAMRYKAKRFVIRQPEAERRKAIVAPRGGILALKVRQLCSLDFGVDNKTTVCDFLHGVLLPFRAHDDLVSLFARQKRVV